MIIQLMRALSESGLPPRLSGMSHVGGPLRKAYLWRFSSAGAIRFGTFPITGYLKAWLKHHLRVCIINDIFAVSTINSSYTHYKNAIKEALLDESNTTILR